MAILSTLLAVLLPILALPFWFFYFDVTPKIGVFLTLVAAACCLVPLRAADNWRSPSARVLTILVLLQVLVLGLATAMSANVPLSISGSNWRRFGLITQLALFAFALVAIHARNGLQLLTRGVLRAVAISGTVIAVYSVSQYFGFDPLLPSAAYHVGEGEWMIVRPPGTIGHANYLGCYLLFVVFLGGSLLVREQDRVWRWAGGAAAIIGAFAVVLSGTRSAILGLLLGVGLLLWRRRPSARLVLVGGLAGLAVLGSFYVSPWGQKLRSRTRWYQEDPRGGARTQLWIDTFRMAMHRPLTGWGPETFSARFPLHQSMELAQAYPDFYHESPHNIVLDELVSKGLLAAALFLVWCGLASLAAWRALLRPADAPIGAAFLAATFSLQFNSFVLVTAFFYLLTGLSLYLSAATPAERAPGPRWPRAVGAILAALFLLFAVRYVVADVLMHHVKVSLEAGNVIDAANTYAQVRRWQPAGVNSDLYYSRAMHANVRRQRDLLLSVKAWQEAIQSAIRSTAEGEEPHNANYHLANLYASVNDRQDAEKSLRAAIQSAPQWFKPHWILAQVLALNGKHAEALAEAEAAVERDGHKHAEVTATLNSLRQNHQ